MAFYQTKLSNGLQLLGETNPSALSTALGFFVRTGARDEVDGESGVTHFLEHMIFKGTEKRDALQVNRDFDRIGADNNAFTSEESTVFHAVVLPEYMPQALDVLADILRPSLRDSDFQTEKKVIKDEIARYEVRPEWAVYDESRKLFFGRHPLGQSILGTRESIDALTRDQMHDYFRRRYVAPNIIAVAAGNFDWNEFARLVEEHCGKWETGPIGRKNLVEANRHAGQRLIPREKLNQEYAMLWAPAPAADSPMRYAANILTSIVGDYTGSRLFWELVDPGLADSADFSFLEYEAAGAYILSFSCQPENTAGNLKIIRRILSEVQKNGVTDEEVRVARTRMAAREVRANERTHRRMLSIGNNWTYLNAYRTLDDELASIDAVTRGDVQTLLDRYPLTDLMTVALGPLEKLD
jgi:predicted Zn-dependent peptidase